MNHRSIFKELRLPLAALLLLAVSSLPLGAKDLLYLSAGQPDSTVILAPPPLPGSAEQDADMAEVVAVHQACTSNEAAVAFSEKKFSVFNFTPAVGEFFQPGRFPRTEAFFEQVQKDAAAATDTAKDFWKRPRPFVTNPSLASGKLEKSFGYPSGHSTESMVLALVLAQVFPEKSEDIFGIARDIGWHRVQIARHYPTDIYAGRVFARAIVREMKASAEFQKDLAEVKKEIAAALETKTAKVETAEPVAAH
jgi:acid phosphatase (class A)